MWNFKSTGRVKTVDSQNPNVQGNVETYRSLTQAEYDELSYEEKHSGIVYFITDGATDHIAASSIRYDNSGTHIASTSVQGAIDALDAMLGAIGDGDLSELESIISNAEVVLDEVQPILPASSGTTGQVLTKTASGADWQDATGGGTVDSVNGVAPDGNKNVQIDVELTQAQYNALPASKNSDNINYYITDGIASESSINLRADAIIFDNSLTGLSDNVQDAIDELNTSLISLNNLDCVLLGRSTTQTQTESEAIISVESLSQFKEIMFMAEDGSDLLCPTTIPMSLYINGDRFFNSYYNGTTGITAWTRYIDDGHVALSRWFASGSGARIYGLRESI